VKFLKIEKKFEGVFLIDGRLATKNLIKGFRISDERLNEVEGVQYRSWDPYHSKLSAAILKGLKTLPITEGSKVLYLGAASGTTASFCSDIVGEKGLVYCVEFAPRAVRDLIQVCEKRKNMLPLLNDARKPEEYEKYVEKVDLVYCDIADPQEVEMFIENSRKFLKKNGYGMIAIKSQSIDVTKEPRKIYESALEKLGKKFEILEKMDLSPFTEDHLFVLVKNRQ
jgi:fibrillarin-like pre-rRNA processing protein